MVLREVAFLLKCSHKECIKVSPKALLVRTSKKSSKNCLCVLLRLQCHPY